MDILDNGNYFGREDEEVVQLVNKIVNTVKVRLTSYRNYLGGRAKFGLSSPNYIDHGNHVEATFDGRRFGDALSVHISTKGNIAYTEFMKFASKIDYSGNAFNGNVVDLMIPKSLIDDYKEPFTMFIKESIKIGFFQTQMNIVSSDVLIDAKKNPGKYSQLIVRVWGFSSYFVDLPEVYQNLIIKRALMCEGNA